MKINWNGNRRKALRLIKKDKIDENRQKEFTDNSSINNELQFKVSECKYQGFMITNDNMLKTKIKA